MKLPRWLHELFANFFGYFWGPCPLCKRNFGGHEWKYENSENGSSEIMTSWHSGKCVCPNCHQAAKKYNNKWMKKHAKTGKNNQKERE